MTLTFTQMVVLFLSTILFLTPLILPGLGAKQTPAPLPGRCASPAAAAAADALAAKFDDHQVHLYRKHSRGF